MTEAKTTKKNRRRFSNLLRSQLYDALRLSNLRKVYYMVVAKLDTNIQYVDKLDISISDPKMDSHTDKIRLSLHLTSDLYESQ